MVISIMDGAGSGKTTGDPALVTQRMAGRTALFMKPGMLTSQLAAFEPPHHALAVDITGSTGKIVAEIRTALARRRYPPCTQIRLSF